MASDLSCAFMRCLPSAGLWAPQGLLVKPLSRVWLFATQWTVAYQTPPSMEFSRQEYWSGLPFLFPGDLPGPGIEPGPPALQEDSLPSELPRKSKRSFKIYIFIICHKNRTCAASINAAFIKPQSQIMFFNFYLQCLRVICYISIKHSL